MWCDFGERELTSEYLWFLQEPLVFPVARGFRSMLSVETIGCDIDERSGSECVSFYSELILLC